MKGAPGWRIDRARYLAGDRRAFLAGHRKVRNGVEEEAGIGMPWPGEQRVGRRTFANPSEIHDRNFG